MTFFLILMKSFSSKSFMNQNSDFLLKTSSFCINICSASIPRNGIDGQEVKKRSKTFRRMTHKRMTFSRITNCIMTFSITTPIRMTLNIIITDIIEWYFDCHSALCRSAECCSTFKIPFLQHFIRNREDKGCLAFAIVVKPLQHSCNCKISQCVCLQQLFSSHINIGWYAKGPVL